jgi:hypothetical protein
MADETEDAHLGLLDDADHEAKLNADAEHRKTELRIHALGAAISRRDWHAVEQAHAAIRDKFYSHRGPPPSPPVDWAEENERLRAALQPFASFCEPFVDADGWVMSMRKERIVDWFGPSDFRTARTALEGTPSPPVDWAGRLASLLDEIFPLISYTIHVPPIKQRIEETLIAYKASRHE